MIRPRLALPAFAALACLAPLSACHLIIDLDDEGDDVSSIDAPVADAPVDSPETSSCAVDLPCPAPTAQRLTVCGRLWDLEDEAPVAPSGTSTAVCSGPTASGPCSVSVRYFDALDYAQNPDTAQPLQPAQAELDHCGRFRAVDITTPTFGFLAIVTDDAGSNAVLRPTFITLGNGEARPAANLRAYVTRQTTDARWTTDAGLSGMTLGERGIYVPIFLHGDTPVAGVRVTRNNTDIPNDDLYFSDAGLTRSTVDPARATTGPNGSAIVINSSTPIQFSGSGAEPAGCQWPQALAMAVPGVVMVQRKQAEQPGGAACP